MKELTFSKLVSLARQECPPGVHAADEVIAALSCLMAQTADPYRAYVWMGAFSAAAAACILIAVSQLGQSAADSVSEVMTFVSWVAQ
ncbi:MAG TPA: hypothetical protein PK052_11275 [Anaerohalosphaeraceae bacterium]|nr:hypothetical protein [Phycisphaerae bacterium]HOK96393.1 hypothetical protein [Anaerohalosphaeraceae bacterium]HOL32549.1 hypothetical protein [Anaerohalosphaeraceae bacterium]HOM75612.1 hypothetical protein [Anaerohalosphaeraceae bacterium]HPC65244.1 hypothetical protein [Anaerohalosphaeraceae bacterium]